MTTFFERELFSLSLMAISIMKLIACFKSLRSFSRAFGLREDSESLRIHAPIGNVRVQKCVKRWTDNGNVFAIHTSSTIRQSGSVDGLLCSGNPL